MRNGTLVMITTFLGVAVQAPFSQAVERTGGTLSVNVDKGTLYLSVTEQQGPDLSYDISLPPGCHDEVSVQREGDRVRFLQPGGRCPMGAIVRLSIRKGVSLDLNHGGGVIQLLNTRSWINDYGTVNLYSGGGTLQSDLREIHVEGAPGVPSGVFTNPDRSLRAFLQVRLMGGVIQVKR